MKLCKIIYRYINEFIDEEKLIEELVSLKEDLKEYSKELDELISKIREIINAHSGKMMRYQYTYDLVINNELYLKLANNMTNYELMDMITSYMMVHNVPSIDQELFDELVLEAINNGKYPKEECWRLATNYSRYNFNFQKIIDYFIEIRDVYYLGELISAASEALDIKSIMHQVIDTKDYKFIKAVRDNSVINSYLEKEELDIFIEELKSANIE